MRERWRERQILAFLLLVPVIVFQMPNATNSHRLEGRPESTKHFVLVHGACHGAWSWYKLVSLLRLSGHKVTALDMEASGINAKQFQNVTHVSDYFHPLREFMASSIPPHQKVILVGHSYGGLGISQAMEMFPDKVAVAVFVTALMPGPQLNVTLLHQESNRQISTRDSHFLYGNGNNNPPTGYIFGPEDMSTALYQRSPNEDLDLALTLIRPLPLFNVEDMSEELVLSTDKYGSVSRVFIVADDDRMVPRQFQEWMIEKNPPGEVDEIRGSDHMVMISQPDELLLRLLNIAERYS